MSDELFGVVQSEELTVARLREAAAAAPKAAWTAADKYGMTPLHHLMNNKALTAEMVRAVGEVVEAEAWEVADTYGMTPVHYLMSNEDALGTELLGADASS